MRLAGSVLILILSTIMSCKKDARPQGILSKPEMVNWMLHMYLAEGRAQMLPVNRDSVYKLFLPYQDTLKKRFHMQDSTLDKSYKYYLENPVEMELIYDAIIDSLSLREQKLLKNPSPGSHP